jgi:hypothetical protein
MRTSLHLNLEYVCDDDNDYDKLTGFMEFEINEFEYVKNTGCSVTKSPNSFS